MRAAASTSCSGGSSSPTTRVASTSRPVGWSSPDRVSTRSRTPPDRPRLPRLSPHTGLTATLRGMTPELEQLVSTLEGLREGVLKKLAGLSEEDARRSTVDSGTNVAGVVQHLTFVESKWFEEIVAGRRAQGERSMTVDPSVSMRTIRTDYRAACEASDEIIRAVGDGEARVSVNRTTSNLRFVMLAVIGETARHAGHADIIREQIDGQTGR